MEKVLTLLGQAEATLALAEKKLDRELPRVGERLTEVLRKKDELKHALRERKTALLSVLVQAATILRKTDFSFLGTTGPGCGGAYPIHGFQIVEEEPETVELRGFVNDPGDKEAETLNLQGVVDFKNPAVYYVSCWQIVHYISRSLERAAETTGEAAAFDKLCERLQELVDRKQS